MQHCKSIDELLDTLPPNKIIVDNAIIAWSKINSLLYSTIICSISGGADSDIMLDICYKCDKDNKIMYVWFDTGLEYQATKDHLVYLENKYGIKIEKAKAIKPIPVSCKEYGIPFLSKHISQNIYSLQLNDFDWKDYDYDYMVKHFTKMGADWWCNKKKNSLYNIGSKKYLKEFLIAHPPTFKISDKCCKFAKKDLSSKLIKDYNADMMIIGIRKAEGGVRSTAYTNCFSEDIHGAAGYRPLFWYKDTDKEEYDKYCNIHHSECYNVWGFMRTGCCGCPFAGKHLYEQLSAIKKYEPKLYKAVNNVFGKSYEYTEQYFQFVNEQNDKLKGKNRLF